MKNLMTKNDLLKNVNSLNDGFRMPDVSYVHGQDVQLLNELGSDLYFANYWFGPKDDALNFAESLAQYFKEGYEKLGPRPADEYDFFGLVGYWESGDYAMVGNVNLDEELAFWYLENQIPEGLTVPSSLVQILFDGNDNNAFNIRDLSKEQKLIVADFVITETKEEYLESIEE